MRFVKVGREEARIRGTQGRYRWRTKWEEEREKMGKSRQEIKFAIWEGGYIST